MRHLSCRLPQGDETVTSQDCKVVDGLKLSVWQSLPMNQSVQVQTDILRCPDGLKLRCELVLRKIVSEKLQRVDGATEVFCICLDMYK